MGMKRRSFFATLAALLPFGLLKLRPIVPAAVAAEDRTVPESKLIDCLLVVRDDVPGPMFIGTADGIFANLEGYAVIPRAEYEDLVSRAIGDSSRRSTRGA